MVEPFHATLFNNSVNGVTGVQESRWTVATLDVVLVETALPEGAKYLDNYPGDWQVSAS